MSESNARLAKAVVDAREAKGWSVRQLAQAAGLSTATIRAFEDEESGFRGSASVQGWLEEALGWSPGSTAAFLDQRASESGDGTEQRLGEGGDACGQAG